MRFPLTTASSHKHVTSWPFWANSWQLREEHYRAFRQHWYQLQARDFRREILDILND
jgi:hypothetical protein